MTKNLVLIFLIWCTLSIQSTYAQWTILCNTGNGFVDHFDTLQNKLYATGFFTSLCNINANYVAQFDGSNWQSMGNGLPHAGHHVETINNTLYALAYQPNLDSNWVYTYDGSNFIPEGEGVYLSNAVIGFSQTANLYCIKQYAGQPVVCGEFDKVGSKNISGIMQWNGQHWDSLGAGLSGFLPGGASVMYPHAMVEFNNDLIVAGNFLKAGGVVVNGIARWDGIQWHAMGSGFNGTVYALAVFNNILYAGGSFTKSGSNSMRCMAKWNGSHWEDPGFKTYYNDTMQFSFIHTLEVVQGNLIFSGGFDRVEFANDTLLCSAVGAFTGSAIDTLQGGLPGNEIEAIAFYQGALYVGGGANNSSSLIARYGGSLGIPTTQDQEEGIKIYPNPSHHSVHISTPFVIEEIRVMNSLGQIIQQQFAQQKDYILEWNTPGVYFIQCKHGKNLYTKKIIIE